MTAHTVSSSKRAFCARSMWARCIIDDMIASEMRTLPPEGGRSCRPIDPLPARLRQCLGRPLSYDPLAFPECWLEREWVQRSIRQSRAENSGTRFKSPGRCLMCHPNALRLCLIGCLSALIPSVCVQATAFAQDTVRIAYIDPLSGGGASIGEVGVKTFQFMADEINAKGGVLGKKLEIVPYDNKLNPQETLVQV